MNPLENNTSEQDTSLFLPSLGGSGSFFALFLPQFSFGATDAPNHGPTNGR